MRLKTASLISALYFLVTFVALLLAPQKDSYIKFLDVGQGDSIFIRDSEGHTVLIDGGGNYQVDQVINQEMPFPVCHFDYLVITHLHLDHVKGLEKILKRCSVDFVMFNDVSYASAYWDDFRHLLEKNNAKNIFSGDEFSIGKINFKVLWPTRELFQSEVKNQNDTSVVLLMDYGNFEALFMGDLEDNFQNDLDIDGVRNLIDGELEVIKIAHHGSYNGVYMPLINALKPVSCVVSVGSGNKFGHPNKKAMEELSGAGCKIMRTDLLGDIVIPIN